jgi:pyruvate,orthophosphate dikinase
MRDAKQHHLVAKKSDLTPASMQEIALRYRELLIEHRVPVVDDPWEQLHACIDMVIRSWDSAKARAYRGAMKIADEWGTAVIVQAMVLGNLGPRSGTGVVLTCEPRRRGPEVALHGDFVVQGQGDDVVSGLVETFPITEQQRRTEATGATVSLENDFPCVYETLLQHARTMVTDHGMFHQEIEFTFEGDRAEDLYMLQTRDVVRAEPRDMRAFRSSDELAAARAATGIGAGGGALCGRVAHTGADISALRRQHPGDPIILLRPDTVPDDIPLLLQVDGMVTGIGGATSHAAVVAQWLGRTCVVGCRSLQVHEELGRSTLAGTSVATGDSLSIDGNDGSIYFGHHPTTLLRLQRGG